jgi:Holliday junction resolvase RusA-like endonuclease
MTYLSPEAIAYKKAVAEIVDADPIDGPLALSMTVYRARKAGDADAYLKGCMDSLNGLAWNDDSQLVQLHVYRRDDKAAPRIEVRIWSVSE